MYPDPNYQDPNSGNLFEVDVNATWKLTAVEHVPCLLVTQDASSQIHATSAVFSDAKLDYMYTFIL